MCQTDLGADIEVAIQAQLSSRCLKQVRRIAEMRFVARRTVGSHIRLMAGCGGERF